MSADEAALMADVREADPQLVAHPLRAGGRNVLHVQRHQRVDHHQKRDRVQREARGHRLRIAEAPPGKRGDRRRAKASGPSTRATLN